MFKDDGKYDEYEWSLTDEEIRSEEGFENATDEDVQLIRQTFALLSLAMFESELNSN